MLSLEDEETTSVPLLHLGRWHVLETEILEADLILDEEAETEGRKPFRFQRPPAPRHPADQR